MEDWCFVLEPLASRGVSEALKRLTIHLITERIRPRSGLILYVSGRVCRALKRPSNRTTNTEFFFDKSAN